MKRYARTALALALALASGSAAALGLGQIEVRSRIGQPFLAEIPIISGDPAELENLQAELASPDTFARIGLQVPTGVVADLQFSSALDSTGNPVIRVTSQQPVTEPLLTFLVSVDWGQGRLVREYSALLDTPRTVSAPLQPTVEEAVVSAPNTIEREPEAPAAPEPVAQAAAEPAPADRPEDNAVAATPEPAPTPAPVAATAPPPPAPMPASAPASAPDELRVRAGDTLSKIASEVDLPGRFTLDQTMIALLRANPDAFIGGNVNRLRQGAVLRVPSGHELSDVEAAQASRLVNGQFQQWQAARRPMAQPASARAAASGAVTPSAKPAATSPEAAAPRTAEARLEIVPPGASRATQAGTQSGINAGGEGEMLRQELQQTQETLAARDAELQEIKGRVAELEQLQKQQQQLITMKDSELAAAQQRLAQSQQPAGGDAGGAMWPWLAGGALLLVIGGGWLLRRRPSKPVFRAPGVTPSIADAFPAGPAPAFEPVAEEVVEAEEISPEVKGAQIAAQAEAQAPAWHQAAKGQGNRQEPLFVVQPGQERLELARAYLDLGDHESARQLLSDVVINGDLTARQQAARMLQELD